MKKKKGRAFEVEENWMENAIRIEPNDPRPKWLPLISYPRPIHNDELFGEGKKEKKKKRNEMKNLSAVA